jgi:endogenous inhibitor of DNA gyrase (YacG/DUF329 family)
MKCPGQDTRYWKPEDIFNVPCPACGKPVEFFKDDSSRKCPTCGYRFRNPRLDLGCAEWCPYAEQCLGEMAKASRDKDESP